MGERLGFFFKRVDEGGRRVFATWLAFCIVAASALALTRNWALISNRSLNRHVANELGIIGYALYDLASILQSITEKSRIADLDKEPYRAFLDDLRNESATTANSEFPLKSIIFIQMESVDAICLRNRYQNVEITPFLNRLIPQCHYFPNTIDHTAAGRTVDGELLAIASLLPLTSEAVFTKYDLSKAPSLPRALKPHGYRSISLHGFSGEFWNRKKAHAALGYDKSYFADDLDGSEKLGWGISDESLLRQAAEQLKEATQPVFVHAILLTNHHPYNHVGDRFELETKNIYEDYIESVRYVDRSIESFFHTLENEGLLQDALIAIYSDHDSGMADEFAEFLDPAESPAFRDSVPLLVYGLRSPPAIHAGLAGLQDLPVIILDELGIEIPHTFIGNSLESVNHTYSPHLGKLSLQESELHIEQASIDLKTLTRISILYPQSLANLPNL